MNVPSAHSGPSDASNAPPRSRDTHLATVELPNEVRQLLDQASGLAGSSRDAAVDRALLELQSFAKEVLASWSRAEQSSSQR
jgi:hypothetical protein